MGNNRLRGTLPSELGNLEVLGTERDCMNFNHGLAAIAC